MALPSRSTGPSDPSARRQLLRLEQLLLVVLLTLAAAAWALIVWQSRVMGGAEDMGVGLTMGMAAPVFLLMWLAMMVAMMLPASAPMILAFASSQARRRATGGPSTPTWLFVLPYLAVWTAFGAAGYGVAVVGDVLVGDSMAAADVMSRAAGGLLVAAGVYQLSPLKRACLVRCRTPFMFMLRYWRDGRWGAVTMGLRHGLYCLGCCWLLFLVLLPLGVMNVGAMVAVAALVFAEKALPYGDTVGKVAAFILIGYGLFALSRPDALPTVM
jgi:predicted metal-binding membrane protein